MEKRFTELTHEEKTALVEKLTKYVKTKADSSNMLTKQYYYDGIAEGIILIHKLMRKKIDTDKLDDEEYLKNFLE
jgi:hypothetical protein